MRVELDALTRTALPAHWQQAFEWTERRLGGRVIAWEAQPRWRPACFFELEKEDGEILPLYWRGARGEFHSSTRPLEREMRVIEVFERNGITVPHPHGVCEDPPGLLLEKIPGRFGLETADDDAHRIKVLDEYLTELARIHTIPIEEFEAIGYRRPESPEVSCLGETLLFERSYRATKTRPDPMIEFQLGWCKRNVPRERSDLSFLVCDGGQFMFDDTRMTGLLDFELAYIGDYAADIASLRTRNLTEPMLIPLGDIMRRYGEISGREIDFSVIDYHTIRFALINPLSVAGQLTDPVPEANYVQYLAWYVCYGRCGLEVMAATTGTQLDPPSIPDERPSRRSPAIEQLTTLLDPGAVGEDGEQAYRLDRMQRIAVYLDRSDRHGPALEAEDLDDVAKLMGRRPSTWQEADAQLEELVFASGPERDDEFIRYFHRRLSREEALLYPVLREQQDLEISVLS
ncbi:MAG: phosphotransferase [bacterium]|nr:phosphotransferase [bacterium]